MSQQSKTDFAADKIVELVGAVIERENLREGNRSFDNLGWIKFYAKELKAAQCKDCTNDEGSPGGQKSEG